MSSPEASRPEPEPTFEINLGKLTVGQVMRLERLIDQDLQEQQRRQRSDSAEERATAEDPYELSSLVGQAINRLSDTDLEAGKGLVSRLAEQGNLAALESSAWGAIHIAPQDMDFTATTLSRICAQEARITGRSDSWGVAYVALVEIGDDALPPDELHELATRVLPSESAEEFHP